ARGAGGAQPGCVRAPAPAPGLVPGGRGQRDPRAAGVFGAAQGLFAAARAGVTARVAVMLRNDDHATPGRGWPGVFSWLLPPVLALAAIPAPAPAQVTATADYLARMDTDADGRVSLDEYLAWMTYAFQGMDRNADGVLTADELPG